MDFINQQSDTQTQSSYPATPCEDLILKIEQSNPLKGQVEIAGAKNAVLVIMTSLLLTDGISVLKNVPCSDDVYQMIQLMQSLGATIFFDEAQHELIVNTTTVTKFNVCSSIMKKMRASILVLGPLLVRFGRAQIAFPGGDIIGARPIDFHLKNFEKMGATLTVDQEFLIGSCGKLKGQRLVLEYPSVGATENLIMAAVLAQGTTTIINAALEPEVFDLISILRKMGAHITLTPPATVEIEGVSSLKAVEHTVMYDRLEVGSLLLAAAITRGSVSLPQARVHDLDVFLLKLSDMGHSITVGNENVGIEFTATQNPKAISFRTAPYPGFPTDLQAPMTAVLALAEGKSFIQETVYENRFGHIRELQKMGAHIERDGDRITVLGVEQLYSASVIANDIRTACSLVLAGLAARDGITYMRGVHHWKRGYEAMEKKLEKLGAAISLIKATN